MTDKKIKIAILGIGNCASSLVQGLEFYNDNSKEDDIIRNYGNWIFLLMVIRNF